MSDLRCITELVHDTLIKGYEQESSLGAVAPCAHFNLDICHYLLVQVWDYFDGDDNPTWHYSLWYFDGEGKKLCDFPQHKWEDGAPWVEASVVAQRHADSHIDSR